MPSSTELQKIPGLPSVFRRNHIKADGRKLFLYGYTPHNGRELEEPISEQQFGGELRFHPLRQEWSVYAANRQNRTFLPSADNDPLAASREGSTITEIPFEDFELAIFENRFPGMHPATPLPDDASMLQQAAANGACEVVVYTPEQKGSLATISQQARELLVRAWIDRYEAHFRAGMKYVLPFENRGVEVGVTLSHPHGQLYAFPFVPETQRIAADAMRAGYDLRNDMQNWGDTYMICEQDNVTACVPPYARYPYEIWLIPQRPVAGPWQFTNAEITGFAHLLGDITARYDRFFGRECPYMLSLHAAPEGKNNGYHFTAQFYPILRSPDKLKYFASVEHTTSVFTVDVLPEHAAGALRNI